MSGLFLVLLLTGSHGLGYKTPYGGAALRAQADHGYIEAAYYDSEPRGLSGWGGVLRGEYRFGGTVYFGLGGEGVLQRTGSHERTDARPTLRVGRRSDRGGDLSLYVLVTGMHEDRPRGIGAEWRFHGLVLEGAYYEFQRDGSTPAYSGYLGRVGWAFHL